jgi:hypothetical protein
MRQKIAIPSVILWFLFNSPVFAGDGWQTDMRVSLMDAQNRLSIGQKLDAADGRDARYDVPAILLGEVMAYIEEPDGGKYWRKFRSDCDRHPCSKRWDILVESDWEGEIIRLSWNPSSFPAEMMITLLDEATGDTMNMQAQAEYSYKNAGKRRFQIEVQH